MRCDTQTTTVSVCEHAVEVRCAASNDAVSRIEAGQQLRVFASGADAATAIAAHQDSWLQGMLLAVDWPLQRLLDELSRYRRGHLACDPTVTRRTVTGTYRLDDIDAALASLCASHRLQVQYFTRYWATVSARPASLFEFFCIRGLVFRHPASAYPIRSRNTSPYHHREQKERPCT